MLRGAKLRRIATQMQGAPVYETLLMVTAATLSDCHSFAPVI